MEQELPLPLPMLAAAGCCCGPDSAQLGQTQGDDLCGAAWLLSQKTTHGSKKQASSCDLSTLNCIYSTLPCKERRSISLNQPGAGYMAEASLGTDAPRRQKMQLYVIHTSLLSIATTAIGKRV